ncbi:HAD family hydrolase [Eisenbergiella tayi]|uniref:HAD family hydrolase n=1 Tax=Eisenbergiella tayi TaxID=1432052 RepID=UPI001495F096|nr:HAD family hydrolase [Eisenbergiella tayi]
MIADVLSAGGKTGRNSDTLDVLQKLKEKGYVIAKLTDLPSAMPDELFKRDISKLLGYFDYYVSSSTAGYRKPNCKGLQMIAEKFGIPITELVFVGDEEKDRRTACNANCKFIQIQRTNQNKESIGSLYELLEILE